MVGIGIRNRKRASCSCIRLVVKNGKTVSQRAKYALLWPMGLILIYRLRADVYVPRSLLLILHSINCT